MRDAYRAGADVVSNDGMRWVKSKNESYLRLSHKGLRLIWLKCLRHGPARGDGCTLPLPVGPCAQRGRALPDGWGLRVPR